ncbi:hypothetical protein BJX70DRAFT_390567 [Aspergillus crustosus]
MDPSLLTDAELQLTRERSLKYRGTAKIYINQIVPHPSISRELDPKNVERLCGVFSRERCRRLDIRNHVTGVVSRRHLDLALRSAGVSSTSLMTNPPDQHPLLEFPVGQVRCLHGQHRLKAAEELLPPSEQWWTVDLYLEAKRFRQLSSRADVRAAFDRLRIIPALLFQGMKLGSLPKALATNCYEEMVHGLGSVLELWSYYMRGDHAKMLKIDPYTVERLQGMAPGVSAKDTRIVKGLVLSGELFSKFTSSERKAVWRRLKRSQRIIPSLHTFFLDMWYLEACANCMKRLAVPCERYPSIKSAFLGIFKPDASNSECLIQTSETRFRQHPHSQANHAELGYRQLWLYAMRHYPKIPKESKSDNLVAKPGCEKADEAILHGMAILAQRLGFDSPQIRNLAQQSPDRQMARDILLKARKPENYQYHDDIFESLVTRICDCFSEAIPLDRQHSPEIVMSREAVAKGRYGLPHDNAQKQDSQFLFLDELHADGQPNSGKVTTFFVRRHVYLIFFGRLPDFLPLSPAQTGSSTSDSFMPASPLFVPDDDQSQNIASDLPLAREHGEGWFNDQSRREPAYHGRNYRRREGREHRRQERRRRRELRVARGPRSLEQDIVNLRGAEEIPEDGIRSSSGPENVVESTIIYPGESEAIDDGQTNMDVDQLASFSNVNQHDPRELEGSEHYLSDIENASAATHIQFDAESEAAASSLVDSGDAAMTDPAREAQAQPAVNTQVALERELEREINRLQSEAEGRAENAKRSSQEAEPSAGERLLSRTESWTDVEDGSDEDTAMVSTIQQREVQPQPMESERAEDETTSHVAGINSGDKPVGSPPASSMEIPTGKTKRHGWLPYNVAQKGNRKAVRRQADDRRVTQVGFTDLELDPNGGHDLDRLREVAEVHEVHGSGQPEEESIVPTSVGSTSALPAAVSEQTVPGICPTIEQTDAPVEGLEVRSEEPTDTQARVEAAADLTAPLRTESDTGLLTERPVWEQAEDMLDQDPFPTTHTDMDEEEGRSRKMPPSKITALQKNKDHRRVPYDPSRRSNQRAAATHVTEQGSQAQQRTRPVTRLDFARLGLHQPQEPEEPEELDQSTLEAESGPSLPPPDVNPSSPLHVWDGELLASTQVETAHEVGKGVQREGSPKGLSPVHALPAINLPVSARSEELPSPQERSGKRSKTETGVPQETPLSDHLRPPAAQSSRAEKVVTRVDFTSWAESMRQGEASPEPVHEHSRVAAQTSQGSTTRGTRKILKPRLVEKPAQIIRTVPPGGKPTTDQVTIHFRARGEDGKWQTVHELEVDWSDPSEVERVARKDARNRKATFYDKDLRKLTPAQCFEAAIEDGTNTIYMQVGGELSMDEETLRSIARDLEL